MKHISVSCYPTLQPSTSSTVHKISTRRSTCLFLLPSLDISFNLYGDSLKDMVGYNPKYSNINTHLQTDLQ